MVRPSSRRHSISGFGTPVAAHRSRKCSFSYTTIGRDVSELSPPIIDGGINRSSLPLSFTFHAFIPGVPGVLKTRFYCWVILRSNLEVFNVPIRARLPRTTSGTRQSTNTLHSFRSWRSNRTQEAIFTVFAVTPV